jgi:hypothetical protein
LNDLGNRSLIQQTPEPLMRVEQRTRCSGRGRRSTRVRKTMALHLFRTRDLPVVACQQNHAATRR